VFSKAPLSNKDVRSTIEIAQEKGYKVLLLTSNYFAFNPKN
jgi:hypothetical protein